MLLCIFKPVAAGDHSDSAGDADGTAELVWSVSGEDDPLSAAIKKVISLDSDKSEADWTQKLAEGLKDSQPLVRQYCVDATADDIGQKSLGEELSMLGEHLRQLTELGAGPIETFSTIQHLETLANSKDVAIVAKAVHAFVLATSAVDNGDAVRRYSLQAIARAISRPGAPDAASVLSAEETASLHAALEHEVKPEDEWAKEKAAVLIWLSK